MESDNQSWLLSAAKATGGSVVGGQGTGTCPVCTKKDKFRFSIGRDQHLKVWCQSGKCQARSSDSSWLRDVTNKLTAAGLPRTALSGSGAVAASASQSGAAAAAGGRPPPSAPTQDDVDRWGGSIREAGRIDALGTARGISVEVLQDAEVGWNSSRGSHSARPYTLPIRHVWTGKLVDVDHYGLAPKRGPKTMHQRGGTTHFWSPDGVDTSEPVFVCEGHIDAMVARTHGLNAASVTGGAGSLPSEDEFAAFAGADVVIVFDCDDPGRRGAKKLAEAFAAYTEPASVKILDLTTGGMPADDKSRKDVSDWFNVLDKTSADLVALAEATAPWDDEAAVDRVLSDIRALFLADNEAAHDHLADLLDDDAVADLPDPDFIIDGWVPRGLYTMLYGEPGVGKTFALLSMTRAVRRGTRWQDHGTRKGATLIYQGEGLAQLKPRIHAWDDRYPLRDDQSMSGGAFLERLVDVTKPEGVAAMVRTVHGYEARHGCEVQMVVIDPLVEFMTGDENGDGMTEATKGLRALAGYLDIAVVVGHHTNATGERARGSDYHRMRAGAFIRMEHLLDGQVGLWQQKQKNAAALALIAEPVEHADSLVLEVVENLPAAAYVMQKESATKQVKRTAKAADNSEKKRTAVDLLTEIIRDGVFGSPSDRSANKVIARAMELVEKRSLDVGRPALKDTLAVMVDPHFMGVVRVEKGPNNSTLHYWNGEPDA